MKLEGSHNPQDRGTGAAPPRLRGEGASSRGCAAWARGPGWRGHMARPGPPLPCRERGLKWREIADHMAYATPAGPYCALYQGARKALFL